MDKPELITRLENLKKSQGEKKIEAEDLDQLIFCVKTTNDLEEKRKFELLHFGVVDLEEISRDLKRISDKLRFSTINVPKDASLSYYLGGNGLAISYGGYRINVPKFLMASVIFTGISNLSQSDPEKFKSLWEVALNLKEKFKEWANS